MVQNYPAEYVLCVNDLVFEYDEVLIRQTLNLLNPRNFNVTLINQHFENASDMEWRQEPWYGTTYAAEKLSESYLTALENLELHPELNLPEPNPFIASDFELRRQKQDQEYPVLLVDLPYLRAWFKEDHKFNVPKRHIYIIMNR
jgi:secreted Zn-dependent insulinase-like peptidase